jgi:G6PDH family F420-dependent oxidoreductase
VPDPALPPGGGGAEGGDDADLSGGRFRLGLGAGENLNEHVVGKRWPAVGERHEMFGEAIDVIAQLFEGGDQSYRGKHFQIETARLWDLPDARVPIGIAVSGAESCAIAGRTSPPRRSR